MNTALIVIAGLLVIIASALVAIAVFLRQRKEPVFNVTFPAIPQPDPVRVEFSQFPQFPEVKIPTINVPKPDAVKVEFSAFPEVKVSLPEIHVPKADPVRVEFAEFPVVRVDLPDIHIPKIEIPALPPASVVITHGVPGQNGQSSMGEVHHMHAPMSQDSVEILKIDKGAAEGYTVVGRRPLDHSDIREALRDPKLKVRYSDGTMSE